MVVIRSIHKKMLKDSGKKPKNGIKKQLNNAKGERHRRDKLNEKFRGLREIVPNFSKMDKSSFLVMLCLTLLN